MSTKALKVAALIVLNIAFLALMFALLGLVGRTYGIGWELALGLFELGGCLGFGVLIGQAVAS